MIHISTCNLFMNKFNSWNAHTIQFGSKIFIPKPRKLHCYSWPEDVDPLHLLLLIEPPNTCFDWYVLGACGSNSGLARTVKEKIHCSWIGAVITRSKTAITLIMVECPLFLHLSNYTVLFLLGRNHFWVSVVPIFGICLYTLFPSLCSQAPTSLRTWAIKKKKNAA